MSLEIREVKNRGSLRKFVNYPERLYRHNAYYVPYLVFDQMDTLDPRTNPASSFCEYALYIAYRDGEPVGRVAAIYNRKNNEQWGHNQVRFGWMDFVDDPEVSGALIGKVVEFGKARGAEEIVGPLGFTDMDPEGFLIEGFDRISTMPLIYNFPYYQKHMEDMGFVKDADWGEFLVKIPDELPEKLARMEQLVLDRYGLHLRDINRRIIRRERYDHKIFDLINITYKDLYGVTELPMDTADRYIGFYLKVLDMRYLTMVENAEGELVGFGVTMPSLAKALQKCRGKLLPFGWWHLAKALFLKRSDVAELLLIGVRPDYRNKGVNGVLIADIFRKYKALGVKYAESNGQLETNTSVRVQFSAFNPDWCKKRRCFIKKIQ